MKYLLFTSDTGIKHGKMINSNYNWSSFEIKTDDYDSLPSLADKLRKHGYIVSYNVKTGLHVVYNLSNNSSQNESFKIRLENFLNK